MSVERIIARAAAYGISTNSLLAKLVRAGLALNLDAEQ
jgi:hypothetical protein